MKTTLLNLRLEDEQIAILDRMAGKALNRQAIGRMLLIAAIEAVEANGGKIQLPPQFIVRDDTTFREATYKLNEPKSTQRK
jgi:hypothetical protein